MPAPELILRGGRVYDGTGAPPVTSDVLIRDGLILSVDRTDDVLAERERPDRDIRVIDAAGKIVCPGFVDLHTHSDLTLLSNPEAHSKIRQGVTTEVVGNCGLGAAPLTVTGDAPAIRSAVSYLDLDPDIAWTWSSVAQYLQLVGLVGTSVNVATLVGQLPLHATVAGFGSEDPGPKAIAEMQALLLDSLDAGAIGLSTGLVYAPLTTVAEPELLALAEVTASRDKLFSWHVRNYDDDLVASVDQAVRVAELTGCRTQISHLTAIGRRNWPKLPRVLDRIDTARAAGVDLGIDIYPYLHGNCPLSQLLPAWAQLGTAAEWSAQLKLSDVRERIIREWSDRVVGWDEVTISNVPGDAADAPVGLTLAEHAERLDRPADEVALDLLAEHATRLLVVVGGRDDDVLRTVLDHPATVVASDGLSLDPNGVTGRGAPHPRSYGCFPRYLSRYVGRDETALARGIARCTSHPATIAGLDRGQLTAGKAADILIIDPDRLTDRATFDQPQLYADGIDLVMVDGLPVVERGTHTGARPGKVLTSR